VKKPKKTKNKTKVKKQLKKEIVDEERDGYHPKRRKGRAPDINVHIMQNIDYIAPIKRRIKH
jgi:hypothetical protein